MSTMLNKESEEWEVISAYSRKQAIEDGFLVDVSKMGTEAGFRYPVALTRAVYDRYVKVPEGVSGQDSEGRLWDILIMLVFTSRGRQGTGDTLLYEVLVRNDNRRPVARKLKAVCHGGDVGEPVITIMLPDED